MADDGDIDDNFDLIQPSLIRQLKNILDQYPDDGQILKELIQNAEDAGAKEIKFLFDDTGYGTKTLVNDELREFQGPALYASNDAFFTDEDWKGIRMLGESLKAKDPIKVGRIGLGFKSIFHLTDMPSIFSGHKLGTLDPHERYFSTVENRRTGKVWNFERPGDKSLLEKFEHQFDPFQNIFDNTSNSAYYNGTLFRFPLRRNASKLSETLYSHDKVSTLFNSFRNEGNLSLLFMKNLEKIEFYKRTGVNGELELLFSFSIDEECLAVLREERKEFLDDLKKAQKGKKPKAISKTFQLKILSKSYQNGDCTIIDSQEYLISQRYDGKSFLKEQNSFGERTSQSLLPLVGVAFLLQQNPGKINRKGHIFCALPLPAQMYSPTGLPVHVNGFFALGSDRKDLKWLSAAYDQHSNVSDKQVLWNQFLINTVLSCAYVELIEELITRSKPTVYEAWPVLADVKPNWKSLLTPLFTKLFPCNCIRTEAGRGRWIKIEESVFMDPSPKCSEGRKVAFSCLARGRVNAVDLPSHVQDCLNRFYRGTKTEMGQTLVAKSLSKNSHIIRYLNLTSEDKVALLDYLLCAPNIVQSLRGVPLLPLEDGFISFYERGGLVNDIYITSQEYPISLLPGFSHRILSTRISSDTKRILEIAAQQGFCQLVKLNRTLMTELFKQILPDNWVRGQQEVVIWQPEISGQPPLPWINELWEYLRACDHQLESVSNLPLFPIDDITKVKTDIKMARVKDDYPLLLIENNNLSAEMLDLLTYLGIRIIHSFPNFIKNHPGVMGKYMYIGNPFGIIHSLLMLCKMNGMSELMSKFHSHYNLHRVEYEGDFKWIITQGLRSANWQNRQELQAMLRKFPVFRTVHDTQKYVCIEDVKIAAPEENDLPPVLPKQELIHLTDDDQDLAIALGVRKLSKIELVKSIIVPELCKWKYSISELDEIMKYLLPLITVGNLQGIQGLNDLKFVPDDNGGRHRPAELFDPSNNTLISLFEGENVFPSKFYRNEPYLTALRKMGLKEACDVSAANIFTSICKIDQNPIINMEVKSAAIANFISKKKSLLEENILEQTTPKKLKVAILNKKWIHSENRKPSTYPSSLQWYNGDVFHKPSEIYDASQASLIGSLRPVVSVNTYRSCLLPELFASIPPIEDVIQHFQHVIERYTEDEKSCFLQIVEKVYAYLQGCHPPTVVSILERLNITDWIWHGNGFISPKQVIVDKYEIDLLPYIFVIPGEMKKFKTLFTGCGVREGCNDSLLLKILLFIKQKHDEAKCTVIEKDKDMRLICQILDDIKDTANELPNDKIYIPVYSHNVSTLKLRPVSQCAYSDTERFGVISDADTIDIDGQGEKVYLVHPTISKETAKVLCRSLTSSILDAESFGVFEACGQGEPLTRRLKRLLQEYKDGFSIPKELIQNADDAGATEVRFLYDERQNRDCATLLIHPAMQSCQGPALWAYNDATFSEEDFENITKLSGATKEGQSNKIGKFGLGFNTVYNVTDVPSFVSKDKLVIFDPHATHLGDAIKDKTKPGIKIHIGSRRERLKPFRHQLKPYDGVFGCNMDLNQRTSSYDGTLFRFPLRTEEKAAQSQIKNLYYDKSEMKQLLQILVKGGHNLLLFTQNVVKMSVYHLSPEAKSPAEMKELVTITRKQMYSCRSIQESNLNGPILEVANIAAHDSDISKQNEAANLTISDVVNIDINITDHGKSCFELESTSDKNILWLVHSCIGQSQSLEMARNIEGLSPCSSVAIHISNFQSGWQFHPLYAKDGYGIRGYIFCYLPLPIASGLPVQINGSFAVNSSRQSLQELSEDDKHPCSKEALWNIALLKDAVAKAYLGALKDLSQKVDAASNIDSWYDLWPMFNESGRIMLTSSCLRSMAVSFYDYIVNDGKEWKIFPSKNGWLSWDDIGFLDHEFYCSDLVTDAAMNVSEMFYKDRITINLPFRVRHAMEDVGLHRALDFSTLNVQLFFSNVFFPNIKEPGLTSEERYTLLLFCLDNMENKDVKMLLESSECIPTFPNGVLKRPKDLVERNSKVGALYSDKDEVFPMGKVFESGSNLVKLRQLGMSSIQITWENLLERAVSVERFSQISLESACQRARNVCKFLEENIGNTESKRIVHFQKKFKSVRFLPILNKTISWSTLKWGGDEFSAKFLAPEDIYPYNLRNLLGCNKPIIDETTNGSDTLKKDVLNFLGICQQPTLDQVFSQLETVALYANSDALVERCAEFEEEIHTIVYNIYSFINEKIEGNEDIIRQTLSARESILVENRFVEPKLVSFEISFQAKPYLYMLPGKLSRHCSALMKVIGVSTNFDADIYAKVLHDIESDAHGCPLEEKNLELVFNLVTMLYNCVNDLNKDSDGTVCKYLPDRQGILCRSQELCIKDVTWMPDDTDVRYVHKCISSDIALKLGSSTRQNDFVMKNSIGLPFGQHEKLTHRLKRIMEGYPCDKAILKELLQNADDAGASELCFVLDPRQHNTERIFSKKWESLQGPALLVYNNACFTQEDIIGIQNLGEGSKGRDPTRSGQYGIGFNVVYHLTDAPSFLTQVEGKGDVLCLFDPQCSYFEGTTNYEPGRMFKDARQLLSTSFTDVYSSYLPEIFKEHKSTIFRLPLRTESMATDSYISSKSVDPDAIRKLMKQFKDEAEEIMLFLKHIKKIRLSEVDATSGKLKDVFSIDLVMSPESKEIHESLVKTSMAMAGKVTDISRGLSSFEELTDSQMFSYDVKITVSSGLCQDWNIVQKVGFMDSSAITDCVKEHISKGNLCLLPKGGIAIPIQRDPKKKMRAFCLLPLPIETGLPVHINGHFMLDHETRRSLWHDECTGYKSEWNLAIIKHVIVPCYTYFVTEDAQRIKKNCIMSEALSCLSNFFQIFPESANTKDDYWNALSTSFYQKLSQNQCCVLPVLRPVCNIQSKQSKRKRQPPPKKKQLPRVSIEWYPPHAEEASKFYYTNPILSESGYLPGQQINCKKLVVDDKVINFLLNIGMNLHNLPRTIMENFETADVCLNRLEPGNVLKYISNHPSLLLYINRPVEETTLGSVKLLSLLLRFCLQDCKDLRILFDSPLLVTVDGYLRKFDENAQRYSTDFAKLIPNRQDLFIHQSLMNELEPKFPKKESKFPKKEPKFPKKEPNVLVKQLELKDLVTHLPDILPHKLKNQDRSISWNPGQAHTKPDKEWVYLLWKFLSQKFNECQEGTLPANVNVIQFLKPLSEWCLLPASRGSSICYESHLVPLGIAYSVLDMQTAALAGTQLVNILKKTRLLELNYKILGDTVYDYSTPKFAARIVGNVKDGSSLIKSLAWRYDNDISSFAKVDIYDARCLLNHLSQFVSKFSITEKQMLKKLPLFMDIGGNLCSIDDDDTSVYVIPPGVPSEGLKQWKELANMVLLKECLELKKLYQNLEFTSSSIADLYCNIIFEHFWILESDSMVKHLSFVKRMCLDDHTVPEQIKTRILNSMKSLRFLKREEDVLCAKDFYDPDNPVFTEMSPMSSFLPFPYCQFFWLEVLRKIGLVQEVSPEMYFDFVIQVSKLANINAVKKKSRILLEYLRDNPQLTENQSLLDKISTVTFLVSDEIKREFVDIHPPRYAERTLVALKGSLRTNYFNNSTKISWTECTFVPSYVVDIEKLPFKKFGVREDLKLYEVINHLLNVLNSKRIVSISDELKDIHNLSIHKVIVSVINGCYEFLTKHVEDFNSQAQLVKLLSNASCILVDFDKKLAKPFITTTAKKQIKPYIWKIPVTSGKYFKVFQKLGCTEDLSPDQCARALTRIKEECSGSVLGPNRQRSAYQAINYLAHALQQEHHLTSKVLYLPSATPRDTIKLDKSTDLVYKDDCRFEHRLKDCPVKFLISECRSDSYSVTSMETNPITILMKHLPSSHKPKYLSQLMHEKLIKVVHTESFQQFNQIAEIIKSSEFSKGIARLIKHQNRKDSENIGRLEEITQLLHNVNLTVVQEIVTALFYDDKEINGSQVTNGVYLEVSNPGVLNIYIYEDAISVDICSQISVYLSKMLDDLFSDKSLITFLVPMLMKRPEDISNFLDEVRIARDYEVKNSGNVGKLPLPGQFVPLELHHLLRNEFDELEEDEYVAFEVEDPSIEGQTGEPTYIFAKVIRKIKNDGKLQSVYRIIVSDDGSERDVFTTELYKFSQPEKCFTGDIVPYIGPETENVSKCIPDKSLEEVMEEITNTLEEAWTFPENQRKRIVKRLYLRWHPDKNPQEKEKFCNDICKYIQSEAKRLQYGLPRHKAKSGSGPSQSDTFDDDLPRHKAKSGSGPSQSNPFDDGLPRHKAKSGSGPFQSNPFDDLFSNWGRRAERHSSDRKSYRDSYFGSGRTYASWVPPTFDSQNPQPGEAKRWYRQAKCDIAAASSDFTGPSYEWICFKCHQAAEKALKAAQYSIDADINMTTNLRKNALPLSDDDILKLATRLESLLGESSKMQYPERSRSIPHVHYDETIANEALELAEKIMKEIKAFLEKNNVDTDL